MDKDIEQRITDLLGENLDRLITIDWRCLGQIRPLYQAARGTSDGPLAMRAAQKLVDIVREGDVVFIMTGFPVMPLDVPNDGKPVKEHASRRNGITPETDGVVGAAMIARAVDLGFRARPVVFCEEECVEIAKACCEAAGLGILEDFETSVAIPHTVTVLPFTKDPHKAEKKSQTNTRRHEPQGSRFRGTSWKKRKRVLSPYGWMLDHPFCREN